MYVYTFYVIYSFNIHFRVFPSLAVRYLYECHSILANNSFWPLCVCVRACIYIGGLASPMTCENNDARPGRRLYVESKNGEKKLQINK